MKFTRKTCVYCSRNPSYVKENVEHLITKSLGGNNSEYNKRPCCIACNSWRGNKDLEF